MRCIHWGTSTIDSTLDAQPWRALPEGMEANSVSLNFLRLLFPGDGTEAAPDVIEIRPNPSL